MSPLPAYARRGFAGLALAVAAAGTLAFGDVVLERSRDLLAQPPEVAVKALVWERTYCRECEALRAGEARGAATGRS